ncbi:uncharacterized protein VTP21DRAFT_2775 [Calcarisporiella thermophila]|uniref:uncharacterized protein n=1 Tax=Calcarisporiella thermophila TaxID=911321 RepID=UPI0037427D27
MASPTPAVSIFKHASPASSHCIHTITQEKHSILSLASNDRYLFSGSQGTCIYVWDLENFQCLGRLGGHQGSILCLSLSADNRFLFSSSADGTVRVWDTTTLKCLYQIFSCHDVGDVFSVVFSLVHNTLYIGCQNTSIQWFNISRKRSHINGGEDPGKAARRVSTTSRFFDCAQARELSFDNDEKSPDESLAAVQTEVPEAEKYEISEQNVYYNAHDGYVYTLCLSRVPQLEKEVLFSGSGDGNLKLWTLDEDGGIQPWRTINVAIDCGIMAMAIDESYLYCGVQDGDIKIWDLETFQMVRSLIAHNDDVLALVVRDHHLYSGSADGLIKQWSRKFECTKTYQTHEGIILSLAMSPNYLISGASDKLIKFWDLPALGSASSYLDSAESSCSDTMLYALDKWIALRTVSGNPRYLDECRQGAVFLKHVLKQLGAEAMLIPGAPGRNPLVFGKFTANTGPQSPSENKPTVLVYGHYDVIAADEKRWFCHPFQMTGQDGYLYGRGVSDNKGPMLAAIFAASELQMEQALDVNVAFLIEGEEECGSVGFYEAVELHKDLIGEVDMILVSNSYWLGEDIPCINYGLRGVIHATLEITSQRADLHSGVEGGAVSEPLIDMIRVLSRVVTEKNEVLIPGFYNNVRSLSENEEKLYDPIISWMRSNQKYPYFVNATHPDDIKQEIMKRWRRPALTIHKIDVSGPNNPTVIPRSARAAVSMRVVPDQRLADVIEQFKQYVQLQFTELESNNSLKIEFRNVADWWLGDPENEFFKATADAIEEEWGIKPFFCREGGSIPAVRWLEKTFGAAAVHLPMGQSSDQAHLNNERIRLQNLRAGKRVIKLLLRKLSKK